MKRLHRFLKTLNIPFKFFSKVGTIPIKFVYNRKEKLIKIVSPPNIKIIGVKIYRSGKKIIVTLVIVILIITSFGVVEEVSKSSFTVPMNENSREVILVKDGNTPINPSWPNIPTNSGSGPSNFPVTPPSGGWPVRGINPYRTPPKVVGPGLGAGANPAGAGGGAANEPDDIYPNPKKSANRKVDEDRRVYSDKKRKSKSKEQENEEQKITIIYRIKEDPGLVRAAESACKDLAVQAGINHLIDELAKGNSNPGTSNVPIGKGLTEYRHRKAGRVIARRRGNVIEILGKSGKDKTNQNFVINRVKRNLKQGLYD